MAAARLRVEVFQVLVKLLERRINADNTQYAYAA